MNGRWNRQYRLSGHGSTVNGETFVRPPDGAGEVSPFVVSGQR